MLYETEHEPDIIQPHNAARISIEKEPTLLRYQNWLTRVAQKDRTQEKREADEYVQVASKPLMVRNQKITAFAPFNDKLSALRTFTRWQLVAAFCLLLALLVGLCLNAALTFLVIVSLFAFVAFAHSLTLLLLSLGTFTWYTDIRIDDEIVHALADAEWPSYSVLCPLYKEAAVIHQLVDGLTRLDYPPEKLEIFLLVEQDDDETLEALRPMQLPDFFHVTLLPPGLPRTKPRSCNYGLLQASGEYVVIYDAEDIPDPLQLKKSILAFAESSDDVACVQAKLNFYNSEQNFLTRCFTAEYSARYDLTLPALVRARLNVPLGGASNHFHTATLRRVGAWDIYNVTEDCDLGMRLAHYGLRTVILDSTTYEEANSEIKNWVRQRSRWIKGFMQTFLVYMRTPWEFVQRRQWRALFSVLFLLGSNTFASVAGVTLWILLGIAFLFWLPLRQPLLLDAVLICLAGLLLSNLVAITLALMGCVKRGQYDLLRWMALHPIYSFLLGIGSLVALYQLLTKPHYWEKTTHGLNVHTEKPEQVSL